MPLIEDQHVIQALSAKRAKESFRVGVRLRRPDRRLDDPRAVPGEYCQAREAWAALAPRARPLLHLLLNKLSNDRF